jgi:hypothetical protein
VRIFTSGLRRPRYRTPRRRVYLGQIRSVHRVDPHIDVDALTSRFRGPTHPGERDGRSA